MTHLPAKEKYNFCGEQRFAAKTHKDCGCLCLNGFCHAAENAVEGNLVWCVYVMYGSVLCLGY